MCLAVGGPCEISDMAQVMLQICKCGTDLYRPFDGIFRQFRVTGGFGYVTYVHNRRLTSVKVIGHSCDLNFDVLRSSSESAKADSDDRSP